MDKREFVVKDFHETLDWFGKFEGDKELDPKVIATHCKDPILRFGKRIHRLVKARVHQSPYNMYSIIFGDVTMPLVDPKVTFIGSDRLEAFLIGVSYSIYCGAIGDWFANLRRFDSAGLKASVVGQKYGWCSSAIEASIGRGHYFERNFSIMPFAECPPIDEFEEFNNLLEDNARRFSWRLVWK